MKDRQKDYVPAQIEILRYSSADVIVTSGQSSEDMDGGAWDEI